MKEPLVSVIISTYNEEKYIIDSINSILNQNYKNIEVIVVDDASTDNTVNLIKNLKNDKIKLYINDVNKKLAYNLNFAILKSNGKYIARMDADDISRKNRIKIQVNYLESHKETDIIASFAKTFGDSNIIKKSLCSYDEVRATLLFTNPICHPTVMFRKSSIDFTYDERCVAGQDYELWSRIIDRKKIEILNEVLLDYRVVKRQRNPKYLQIQKENGLKARKYLFDKLFEFSYDKDKYWEIFKLLIDIDFADFKPKNQKQMENLIKFSDCLLEKNREKKVFEERALKKALEKIIFWQWYLSVNKTDISSSIFLKSKYISVLKNQNILVKLKVLYKIFKSKL